tara:strand:+ start:498 stop:638 length:141 start_codon:yes stop_codon:yes gene_type:complete
MFARRKTKALVEAIDSLTPEKAKAPCQAVAKIRAKLAYAAKVAGKK